MKLRTALIVLLIASVSLPIVYVQAHDWSKTPINSGYAITTDWHGKNVPLGSTVNAVAGTNDSTITKVRFIWKMPDNITVVRDVNVTTFHLDTWEGQTVRAFEDSYAPTAGVGDWGVQAVFYDGGGHGHGPYGDKIAIRATSFMVIPEVPLGTITILIAMLGAAGLFALKKKHVVPIRMPS